MAHVRVSLYGDQAPQPLPFGFYAWNTWAYPQHLELIGMLEAPPGKAAVLETDLYFRAGDGVRLIPFGLGVPVPKNHQASSCKAPGLAVQWIEAEEPRRPLAIDRFLAADFPKALSDEIRLQNGQTSLNQTKETNRDDLIGEKKAFRRIGARFFRRDLAGGLKQVLGEIARRSIWGRRSPRRSRRAFSTS
jgi:hypothetical protein